LVFPHSLPLGTFRRGPAWCFGHTPDMGSLEALAELRAMRWTRYASRSTILALSIIVSSPMSSGTQLFLFDRLIHTLTCSHGGAEWRKATRCFLPQRSQHSRSHLFTHSVSQV
jgi:hypothetical protein